jgi:hypothetical protein
MFRTHDRTVRGVANGLRRAGVLLTLLGSIASVAAEDLATWTDGAGTIAAAPATPAAVIADGVTFACGATGPAHVAFTTAPGSIMTLGANASGTLSVETDALGKHLILVVNQGAIEVNIKDKGTYVDFHTRGAVMDVRITGTLFIFERVHRDRDYIALIEGHVTVKLRREIVESLGKGTSEEVALQPHQGLPAQLGTGLGAVEHISGHPSVLDARSLHAQGASGASQGGSLGAGELTTNIGKAITESTGTALFEDIDKGVLSIQILGTALAGSGAATPLGPPPGHPGH